MKKITSFVLISLFFLSACNNTPKTNTQKEISHETNEQQFNDVLKKHLNAVVNKDLETLKSTLSPKGNMQLILPKTETTNTVQDFVEYHKEWFAIDVEWTFETKIQNTKVGKNLGMAVVEVIYREPLRDGKPYFHRMVVSYDLEKMDGQWYFIKDHASSLERSTDLKN